MIPIINNSANFINGDGVLTNRNVNLLFRNKRIGKFNIKSGVIFNSNIDGINHIESKSSIIGTTQSVNISIDVPIIGGNKLEVHLLGATFSYNFENIKTNKYVFLNSVKHISGIDLSGIYKVDSIETMLDSRKITIEDITNSIVSTIPNNDFIVDLETAPNILTLSSSQFENCYIKSGLYQRSNHVNNIFNSEISNINLNNLQFLSKLRISENILTSNEVKMAVVQKSHILDIKWSNGFIFNSIWSNKKNFLNGVISNSFWLSGTFSNGLFSKSNSMLLESPEYSNLEFYRSWNYGNFLDGVFSESKWLSGTFSNGNFIKSDWLSGLWINGILGESSSNTNNTTFGNLLNTTNIGNSYSVWQNGIVDNSIVGGNSSITWKNGTFRSGLFTANQGYYSTWENGRFDNGTFNGIAKWQNGRFNNGLFSSFYGLGLHTSTQSVDYPWENGKFNGGVFGSGDYFTNSSWYYGEFNGGIFKGKVWNDGVFSGGEFLGSGTYSPISNPNLYVSSFTQSFYGIWRDGVVSDTPLGLSLNRNLTSDDYRENTNRFSARFKNILWLGGTFSHQSAIFNNSVWLKGSFNKGFLIKSSFNPYVDRRFFVPSIAATHSFNLDTCIWRGGRLEDSDFHISEWLDGTFVSGTMSGAIWEKGTWLYGNANNILWKGGRWKNGNWNGTPFDYTYLSNSGLLDDYSSQITKRINSYLDPSDEEFNKLHINNAGLYFNNNTNLMSFQFSPTPGFFNDYYDIISTGSDWIASSTLLTNLNSGSFSKILIAKQYFCDRSGCGYKEKIFRDNTIGYRISINARKQGSSSILILNIGDLIGPSSSVSTGQAGFYTNNRPYINLSDSTGTYSFIYYPKEGDNSSFTIRSLNTGGGTSSVFINNITINKIESFYNSTYNNKLVNCNISSTASLPFGNTFSTPYTIAANNSNYISINFGNGLFNSGIWENGVWNNGWRKDKNISVFDNVSDFIRIDNNTYSIRINGQFLNQFNIGDRISISNIIGLDLNGSDILIKSPFVIRSINNNSIVALLKLDVPLRGIIKDSENHSIMISKNIWLSGAFLNGYFSGIFNYGLIKGNPMITHLNRTHMIDGIFDGGQISTSNDDKSSLIQNFEFYDNSYDTYIDSTSPDINSLRDTNFSALGVNNRKYLSWINLNYSVDITSTTFTEDSISNASLNEQIVDVLSYGTADVLRSESNLRRVITPDIFKLSLGFKYKKYNNFISSNTFNYPTLGGNNVSSPIIENFNNNGWEFSQLNTTFGLSTITPDFATYSINFDINQISNIQDLNKLVVSVDGFAVGSSGTYGNLYLKNSNTINLQKNRYTMVEMKITEYTGDAFINVGPTLLPPSAYTLPKIYFNNKPIFGEIPYRSSIEYVPTNHLLTESEIKREFFYNRKELSMIIFGGPQPTGSTYTGNTNTNIKFEYIKYYEVDSIPFYRYYGANVNVDRIDRYVKVPTRAIAPPIIFSDDNLEFISSIRIKTESILNSMSSYPTSPSSSSFIESGVDFVIIS